MSSVTSAVTQANNEFNQAVASQTGGSTMDKEAFMLLLVTQFKYQDPLNPMEDKEFISQMSEFSSLEQLMNLNTSMNSLTEATNNQQLFNATSYIGKQVSVSGNTIGKTTDGEGNVTVSKFRYAFGDNVTKGTLTVRDSSGNTVYTEDMSGKQAGTTFEFQWQGITGAGALAPDGVYTVSLAAFNSKGESVLSDQVVDATVTGIVNNEGVVYLGLDGGQLMPLANVRQVSMPTVVSSTDLIPNSSNSSNDSDSKKQTDDSNSNSSANNSESSTTNSSSTSSTDTTNSTEANADDDTQEAA